MSYFTDDIIETEFLYSGQLNPIFKIVFIDEFRAILNIIKELKSDFDFSKSNWNKWIDNLYNRRPIYSLTQTIQRGKLASIVKSDITYNLFQAERQLGQGNSLTREPQEFWNENSKKGFSRFAKAFLEDSKTRKCITNFTQNSTNLPKLYLHPQVIVNSNWAHDSFSNNLVSVPDIISKYRKGKMNIASETVQNKLAKKIGRRPGEINCEHYLLDYLKTIGNYDLIYPSLNLQFEFIPHGKTLGGLTDIANKDNIIMISFWGIMSPFFSRFGEIISAFHRIGKYGKNITDEAELLSKIYKLINYGKSALGFTRRVDGSTQKLIKDILIVAKKADGEGTFYQGVFIEFLREYGNQFFFNL